MWSRPRSTKPDSTGRGRRTKDGERARKYSSSAVLSYAVLCCAEPCSSVASFPTRPTRVIDLGAARRPHSERAKVEQRERVSERNLQLL